MWVKRAGEWVGAAGERWFRNGTNVLLPEKDLALSIEARKGDESTACCPYKWGRWAGMRCVKTCFLCRSGIGVL